MYIRAVNVLNVCKNIFDITWTSLLIHEYFMLKKINLI